MLCSKSSKGPKVKYYILISLFIFPLCAIQLKWNLEQERNLDPLLEPIHKLALQHCEDRSSPIPIVAVGGCSGSGKSSFSEILAKFLQTRNLNVYIFHLDDFLLSHEERQKMGFQEGVSCLFQLKKVHETLTKMLFSSKQFIEKPTYNEYARTYASEIVNLEKIDLVIFEGIYALCDVSPINFLQYCCLSIFLETDNSTIIQRIYDRNKRRPTARNEEEISQFLQANLLEYRENILPSRDHADFIIKNDNQYHYSILN